MGPGIEIVEFGAGSLRKVRILLDAPEAPRAYTAAGYFRRISCARWCAASAADYPALTLRPMVGDFHAAAGHPAAAGWPAPRRLFPRQHHRQFRPMPRSALLRRMRTA
jgi:uncharacterized SAM-dependent methyltransferase